MTWAGGLEYWTVFMLCKLYLNGAPRIFKFFRYFAKKKRTKFPAKDSTSTSFTATGHQPFLNVWSVDLALCKNGLYFIFLFWVCKTNCFKNEHFHYYKAPFDLTAALSFHVTATQNAWPPWLLTMNAIYSSLCMWLSELLYVDATCHYTCTHTGLICTYKWPTCN